MTEDMLDFLRALHRAGARFLLESPSFDGAFGGPLDLRDLEEL